MSNKSNSYSKMSFCFIILMYLTYWSHCRPPEVGHSQYLDLNLDDIDSVELSDEYEQYDDSYGKDVIIHESQSSSESMAPSKQPLHLVEPPTSAPEYMLNLYDKFSSQHAAYLDSNIVRSFVNINEELEDDKEVQSHMGRTTRKHTIVFNITEIKISETINIALLRLYTLVENDRHVYNGVDRKVSLYEVMHNSVVGEDTLSLIETKHAYGDESGWEVFDVTNPVHKWVEHYKNLPVMEVHIESLLNSRGDDIDIETKFHTKREPIIVVFSNDFSPIDRVHNEEIDDMLVHENETDLTDVESIEDILYNDSPSARRKRSLDLPLLEQLQRRRFEKIKLLFDSSKTSSFESQTNKLLKLTHSRNVFPVRTKLPPFVENDGPDDSKNNSAFSVIRNRRNVDVKMKEWLRKGRRKKGRRSKRHRLRRNICQKQPMYVNFEDINWHNWIIAPRGFQAFECVGRCYFPLDKHLSPTKHAVIQSLMHAVHPAQTLSRACCVPTRLEPISILFVENGIVTYKYKYDGMVVTECGCR